MAKGEEVGDESGYRCRSTDDETEAVCALVATIIRGIDEANAQAVELRSAIPTKDRQRIIEIRSHLQTAWADAYGAIVELEKLSGHTEWVAREALRESQESARESLSQMWKLILANQIRRTPSK